MAGGRRRSRGPAGNPRVSGPCRACVIFRTGKKLCFFNEPVSLSLPGRCNFALIWQMASTGRTAGLKPLVKVTRNNARLLWTAVCRNEPAIGDFGKWTVFNRVACTSLVIHGFHEPRVAPRWTTWSKATTACSIRVPLCRIRGEVLCTSCQIVYLTVLWAPPPPLGPPVRSNSDGGDSPRHGWWCRVPCLHLGTKTMKVA